jgi:hypothetical protein
MSDDGSGRNVEKPVTIWTTAGAQEHGRLLSPLDALSRTVSRTEPSAG